MKEVGIAVARTCVIALRKHPKPGLADSFAGQTNLFDGFFQRARSVAQVAGGVA